MRLTMFHQRTKPMPASSQPVQQGRTETQDEQYAVYDRERNDICHTDDGVVLGESREAAAEKLAAVADQLDRPEDQLVVVRLTITPVATTPTEVDSDETHDTDADRTTGSLMITRGPHRQNPKLVEYRQAEDGAWAVKTPVDDEFWIFLRSGTERDVHQHIRAKWDATYSNPDAFTDQSCPTEDL